MKKRLCIIFISFALILFLASCKTSQFYAQDYEITKRINKVDTFPDLPVNYSYFNYERMAKELDALVFGFADLKEAKKPSYISGDQSTWNPLGFWVDQERQPSEYNPLVTGYLKRTFGFPTYVGDNRVLSSGSEAITNLSMILGSSYAGIDKSNQSFGTDIYDFVEMTMSNYDTGSKLVHNKGAQGQSFWYDIFPQIIFAKLYDLYRDTPYMKEMVLNGADEWVEALPYFLKDGKVDYEFVGYNVVLEAPTVVGNHIEPPNGGLAFLFYSAYEITKDEKYLKAAKEVLDYFQTYNKNPNYEAMTDYAPYVASILNSKYGTNYDVGKFLDFVFESDSAFRSGWSVMNGSFGPYAVDGLVGQSNDYAFAMNSFHLASVLAPMVKYDSRYASAIGKYLLNLVNNAKVFFPQNLGLSNQSMNNYLKFDAAGSIIYEGFRNNYNGQTGYAMGDATAMFGQPSDLSLYSSALMGALGGIIEESNVKGILKVNLNNTDSYGRNDYENYLFYNPYEVSKTIEFTHNGKYDLYDAVNKKIVARNVQGTVNVNIPAKGSKVLVVLPAKSEIINDGHYVMVNHLVIAEYKASVNILDIHSRQELTSNSILNVEYFAPLKDEVSTMKIYFDDILAYDGRPLTEFSYDKSILPDTDYTLKIEITTKNGLTDYATKRVVCR
jgi:hypothetical protein